MLLSEADRREGLGGTISRSRVEVLDRVVLAQAVRKNNRLNFNALLFRNDVAQTRGLLANHHLPLSWMRPVASKLLLRRWRDALDRLGVPL